MKPVKIQPDFSKSLYEELRLRSFFVFGICDMPSLLSEIYAGWGAFFRSDEKYKYRATRGALDGYFPLNAEKPIGAALPDPKEFYHVYQWGKIPTDLAGPTLDLFTLLKDLAVRALDNIQASLPTELSSSLSMPLPNMIADDQRVVLRVAHYPRCDDHVRYANTIAAEHKDITLITILPPATNSGLESRVGGDAWENVQPKGNQMAVLAGELLEIALKQHLCASVHRVVATCVGQERLSLNFFANPPDDMQIGENQTAGALLRKRLNELGYLL